MANKKTGKAKRSAPDHTLEEVKYLRHLTDSGKPVCIHLFGGEVLKGTVEFFDTDFIRLTRDREPNLFIFKRQIKLLYEQPG